MELTRSNKTFKKYRQGNITSTFGTELLTIGATSIPNLLLKYYKQIGITDEEMMIIIQLLRIRTEYRNLNPSPEQMSKCLSSTVADIKSSLINMLDKGVVSLTEYYDEESDEIFIGYDLEPLMEKLSEIWACEKMQEIEKTRFMLDNCKRKTTFVQHDSNSLYHAFEKEFGRPLSPMEIDQIQKWLQDTPCEEIILEALRRAVLLGKHNFKYIDSILLEWKKNNLRTLNEIENHNRKFYKSKKSKSIKPHKTNQTNGEDKKKEFIKALYMN